MVSYEHKSLLKNISAICTPPDDPEEFQKWICAGDHLKFIKDNANDNEKAWIHARSATGLKDLVKTS